MADWLAEGSRVAASSPRPTSCVQLMTTCAQVLDGDCNIFEFRVVRVW